MVKYVSDMCLDDESDMSDEVMPNKLQFVTPRSRDTVQRRQQATARGHQLAMTLDGCTSYGNCTTSHQLSAPPCWNRLSCFSF